MTRDWTDDELDLLGALADGLIPADEHLPAGSVILTDRAALTRVGELRPDLTEALQTGVDAARSSGTRDAFALRTADAAVFDAFAVAVAGVYLTDTGVAAQLGYHGRRRLDVGDIDRNRELVAALAAPVAARGWTWDTTEDKWQGT